MKPLQRYWLERFCREHSIDVAEIDSKLTYAENIDQLSTLVGRSIETLNPGEQPPRHVSLIDTLWEGNWEIYV